MQKNAPRPWREHPLIMWAVLVLGVATFLYYLYQDFSHVFQHQLLDVGVFRDAGYALREGLPLYSEGFPTRSGYRFIYPPFAALLFLPLTWVNENLMEFIWTLATAGTVVAIVAMACQRLGLQRWWIWSLGLAGGAIYLDPIRENMGFGQINVFLILLVTMDVLGFMPRRLRGLGVGIAAGIKITPAAFALLFLVRKDWLSLARSAGFFLLTALIGWVIRPAESVYFWTEEFFATDRGGPASYPANQALTGLIARAGVDNDTAQSIMKIGFLLIAALSVWCAWKLERAGRSVDALLLVVLGIVISAPIAVSHHWSGVILALPLLIRPMNRVIGVCTALMVVMAGMGWWYSVYMPEKPGYSFAFPEWFIGNSMGLAGVALFCAYIFTALSPAGVSSRGRAQQGRA